MSTHRRKHKQSSDAGPKPPAPQREFAFSRIAGAGLNDYAPISTLAVVATVIAVVGGLLGLALTGWWLIGPGLGLALGLLALYYIETSAGTLSGRQIALVAVSIGGLLGLAGGGLHIHAHYRAAADTARVRELAGEVRDHVRAGDYDAVYEQLSPEVRQNIPPAHWRYEWRRLLGEAGEPTKIELSDRVLAISADHIVMTLNMHFPPPAAADKERVYSLRLIYGRAADADATGERWELINAPGFVAPLPPRYLEPLVWPRPGKPAAKVVVEDEQYDLADDRLAPPPSLYRDWLPQRGN